MPLITVMGDLEVRHPRKRRDGTIVATLRELTSRRVVERAHVWPDSDSYECAVRRVFVASREDLADDDMSASR